LRNLDVRRRGGTEVLYEGREILGDRRIDDIETNKKFMEFYLSGGSRVLVTGLLRPSGCR
jgi:hypothetical protein